jgi:transcription elongation factor Elf1
MYCASKPGGNMKKGEFKKTDYNEIRECVKCHERKLITEFVKGKGELYRYRCKSCCNEALRTGRPKKGRFKKTDYNEIRECVDCHERKLITEFVKGKGELYRYQCKDCKNKARRTGRPNEGKFKPGHDKGKRYQKGHTPWHNGTKGQFLTVSEEQKKKEKRFDCWKYKQWKKQVLERDGYKCMRCGSDYFVNAHHIKPWRKHPALRFDIENGMALCGACHGKEEGFKKGHVPWNKK